MMIGTPIKNDGIPIIYIIKNVTIEYVLPSLDMIYPNEKITIPKIIRPIPFVTLNLFSDFSFPSISQLFLRLVKNHFL